MKSIIQNFWQTHTELGTKSPQMSHISCLSCMMMMKWKLSWKRLRLNKKIITCVIFVATSVHILVCLYRVFTNFGNLLKHLTFWGHCQRSEVLALAFWNILDLCFIVVRCHRKFSLKWVRWAQTKLSLGPFCSNRTPRRGDILHPCAHE